MITVVIEQEKKSAFAAIYTVTKVYLFGFILIYKKKVFAGY